MFREAHETDTATSINNGSTVRRTETVRRTSYTINSPWDDTGKLILRLTISILLIFHGIGKITGGIAWLGQPLASINMPTIVEYGIYIAEIIAPIFIILGVGTRIAALVIAFDMLMAVLLVGKSNLLVLNPRTGGWALELEALYFFGALAIFFLGAGRYSATKGEGSWN